MGLPADAAVRRVGANTRSPGAVLLCRDDPLYSDDRGGNIPAELVWTADDPFEANILAELASTAPDDSDDRGENTRAAQERIGPDDRIGLDDRVVIHVAALASAVRASKNGGRPFADAEVPGMAASTAARIGYAQHDVLAAERTAADDRSADYFARGSAPSTG